MQAGDWAPAQRLTRAKVNRQCKLGIGPQHRDFRERKSTDSASWGVALHRAFRKEMQPAMEVGKYIKTKLHYGDY
ncbi:hypothetical protein BN1318_170006 [Staphylococcus capitis]|nr:hypothetical protein BN1318_170006 [Staphylococcus capitis]